MAKKLKTCIVCKSQYHFCPICGEDKNKPSWYMACCSEDCHTVLGVIADYSNNKLTKDEAKNILNGIDKAKLDSMVVYTSNIKEIVGTENETFIPKEPTFKKKKVKVAQDELVEATEV